MLPARHVRIDHEIGTKRQHARLQHQPRAFDTAPKMLA